MINFESFEVPFTGRDKVNEYFSIYLILPASLDHGVYSASRRNGCQKLKNIFLRKNARQTRELDNITANCVQTVETIWDPQNLKTL
jgi:hypothetical protein